MQQTTELKLCMVQADCEGIMALKYKKKETLDGFEKQSLIFQYLYNKDYYS